LCPYTNIPPASEGWEYYIANAAPSPRRTKFPIKSLPTLKALAANIEPIPVPNTIPPPPVQPGKPRHQEGAKGKGKEAKEEPIVVD
jgi:hypothetical protein